MTFSYFGNFKTFGYLLSCSAIIVHFAFTQFIMLEKDYKWVVTILSLWSFANLTTETDGLFFKEMAGAKNIVKVTLAAFFVISTTCLYFWLCQGSQLIKDVYEKQEKRKILKQYGRAEYNSDEEDQDDSETQDSSASEKEDDDGVVPLDKIKSKVAKVNSEGDEKRERFLSGRFGQE